MNRTHTSYNPDQEAPLTTVPQYTGTFTVAGPIIQALGQDVGIQTSQIANRTAIYSTAPKARNRVNTSYMVLVFLGQTSGTLIGNRLYARGGWIASGSASVGFISMALLFSIIRGPHEEGWIGWGGGWNIKRRAAMPATKTDEERAAEARETEESVTNSEGGSNEQVELGATTTSEQVKSVGRKT